MGWRRVLPTILAVVGAVVVWLPLLVAIAIPVVVFTQTGVFYYANIYLMPAEYFPLGLLGCGLLLWAALLTRQRRQLVGAGFAAAIAFLVVSQVLLVLTGLSSGRAEWAGWRLSAVLFALVGYDLAVLATGVGGILLLFDLAQTRNL